MKNRHFKGVHSGKLPATGAAQPLMKNFQCDFVMLSVLNTLDDGADTTMATDSNGEYETSDLQIYYGWGGACVHPLFPTETTTFLPVENANEIFVRNSLNKGSNTLVTFTLFRYVEDK